MRFRSVLRVILALAAAALSVMAIAQTAPQYEPTVHASGTIRIWGSPQMTKLLNLYESDFQTLQPDVRFETSLKSTLAAVPGVYTGRAEIGMLGREIWPTEVQVFEAVAGKAPEVIDIATGSYDVPKATYAPMIFVPAANPIRSLSIAELERIFGASDHPARTWGDLGLHGIWKKRPIHLYGFETDNDKARVFARRIFRSGEPWSRNLIQVRHSAGTEADAGGQIIRSVSRDPDAIGISNVHYSDPSVRAVPLSITRNQRPVEPTRESVASREYPLTRAVCLVIDSRTPEVNPPVREFILFILSEQGREAVIREGNYLPLPPEIAKQELGRISGR